MGWVGAGKLTEYEIDLISDGRFRYCLTLLKQWTIPSVNESYPEPEWFQVYIDSSKIGMHGHARTGEV